ncbi:MAG TPA: hypothetical protein VK716_05845 [Terracidiphilus sp.]|nr:hypothetical protein [Terracidiphilus sp.]
MMRRIWTTFFVVAIMNSSALAGRAQDASPNPPPQNAPANQQMPQPPATPAPTQVTGASKLLQPALDQVQQTLNKAHVERWKKGSVRDEASTDISSLQSDLQGNLPSLLRDSDAAPSSLSRMLPVEKHVDAVYDVLLRVVEAARIAAPDEQANALRQALSTLSTARLAFDDGMLSTATVQEKQISDLRVTVQKQAAFRCPAPPPEKPCPPPPPVHRARKPAAATSTATPTAKSGTAPAAQKPGTTNPTSKPGTPAPNQKPSTQKPSTTPTNPQ